MSRTLRSPADLIAAGFAAPADHEALTAVASRYAVAITPAMASLITAPDDPIARQFVPSAAELTTLPTERSDPIGDAAHSPVPGIVHRYPDRVLLKLTHVCPVYCRFCFRREMVGPKGLGALNEAELAAALAYIAAKPAIFEVIVTGGDPFVLSARRIRQITRAIAAIAHVRVIRWHSRVPVVQPKTVTSAFVAALRAPGIATYVAIHANHASEFSPEAITAIARLADAGIVLLSQSVLLRGVNDSVPALEDLMRSFVAHRIKPYYLHHGDLAPGTSHFRVPMAEGLALVAALRGAVSGLCQPTYVVDIPGGYGKVPVSSCEITPAGITIPDRTGQRHHYEGE